MLTDAQREAALEQLADAIMGDCGCPWRCKAVPECRCFRAGRIALDALTDAGYLLIARDDVTEEKRWTLYGKPPTHARLVTRWEPITKEEGTTHD